jgi:hypothetical protein
VRLLARDGQDEIGFTSGDAKSSIKRVDGAPVLEHSAVRCAPAPRAHRAFEFAQQPAQRKRSA